ncbi:MAG: Npun_F0494 family protein [Cyanobacteria bacterium P01_G01_bin.49]
MRSSTHPLNFAYTSNTLRRAERALCCAPFQLALFLAVKTQSVPLPNIAGETGVQQGYTFNPLSEQRVEKDLMWLIQVGLLRREVDGQGITDSFRLTPLGRQLVAKWKKNGGIFPQPSWWEGLINQFIRWFSFLF